MKPFDRFQWIAHDPWLIWKQCENLNKKGFIPFLSLTFDSYFYAYIILMTSTNNNVIRRQFRFVRLFICCKDAFFLFVRSLLISNYVHVTHSCHCVISLHEYKISYGNKIHSIHYTHFINILFDSWMCLWTCYLLLHDNPCIWSKHQTLVFAIQFW